MPKYECLNCGKAYWNWGFKNGRKCSDCGGKLLESKIDKGRIMEKNRYLLTMMVAERAKQLLAGAKPLVKIKSKNPVDVSLQEIKEGKVYLKKQGTLKEEDLFKKILRFGPNQEKVE
ncbi:DNA-directed RNA polymerase subunit omega [subsurface metagenome]|nr:MAG: DNA-directed RNA polymerase subunit omega [Candidatus Atribacteria bacterium 1244-E10-H5-B2]